MPHNLTPMKPRLGVRARALRSLKYVFPAQRQAGIPDDFSATQQTLSEKEIRPSAKPTLNNKSKVFKSPRSDYRLEQFVQKLGGIEDKHILDFGCGSGAQAVWLAKQAKYVAGCDVKSDSIEKGRDTAKRESVNNVEFFTVKDIGLPFEDNSFDAVFSIDVFEHVMHTQKELMEIARVLKPGGSFMAEFGPLFYSPRGYHLFHVTQVPFAHIVFGLKPIMQLRSQIHWPIEVSKWQELGMNQITFEEFRDALMATGFNVDNLQRIPIRNCRLLSNIPLISKYFTTGINCHAIKKMS